MKKYFLLLLLPIWSVLSVNAQNFAKFDVTDKNGVEGLNGLAHRTGARVIDILVPNNFDLTDVSVDYELQGSGVLSGEMPSDFSTPQTVKTKNSPTGADVSWTVTIRKVKPDILPLFLDFTQESLNTVDWNEETKGWAWAAIDTNQKRVIRFGNLTATFIVAFDDAAESVSYALNTVGNDFGDALFHVYASADGSEWSTLRTFDESNPLVKEGQSYTDELEEDIRYVKWIYTTRTVNVNLNNIAVLPAEIDHPAEPEDPFFPDFNPPREIEGMELVWSDEFNYNGKPNAANWRYENGFVRNEELQWYQPDNVICKDGVLLFEAKRETVVNPNYEEGSSDWKKNREFAEYTSSSVLTQNLKTFKYGRFEIRARIDTTLGAWPAIWAKGVSGSWPYSGEIDIMEFYRRSKDPKRPVILANLAWGSSTNPNGTWNTGRYDLSDITGDDDEWCDKFHVWRMDWDEENISLYLDDRLLNTQDLSQAINPEGSNPSEPFQQEFYFLLNLAIGSNGGDPSGSDFPIRYEVDYIRVYQPVTTSVQEQFAGNTKIYPNPAKDILNIESDTEIEKVSVFDLSGRKLLEVKPNNKQVDISKLNEGSYLLRVEDDTSRIETVKIIKSK